MESYAQRPLTASGIAAGVIKQIGSHKTTIGHEKTTAMDFRLASKPNINVSWYLISEVESLMIMQAHLTHLFTYHFYWLMSF